MSEGSWIFGVICGIIISLATVPYAVCYARYDNFELHDAYISEVKQTIPIAIREYLKNKPWDSFFIKIFKAQSATEDLASKIAEHIVESMVREEGPDPPSKKRKTPLCLMLQADRVFVRTKNYHQRGATNYDTGDLTIQVRTGKN